MEGEQIALFMAFFIDGLHAVRPACGFADRNGIRLKRIIAPEAPSVQMHVGVPQAVVVQLAELVDDILRRQILAVFLRILMIVGTRVRLEPIQNACVDDRAADHFRDFRRTRDFLLQRHEMARHLRMFAIGLRHRDVVAFRKCLDANAPCIAEFSKLRNEACFQLCRTACRMMENDAEIIMRLNDHHGGAAMIFNAPPRHRQDAGIGQIDVGFWIERVGIADDFTRPVFRNQHALHERQDGCLDIVFCETARPAAFLHAFLLILQSTEFQEDIVCLPVQTNEQDNAQFQFDVVFCETVQTNPPAAYGPEFLPCGMAVFCVGKRHVQSFVSFGDFHGRCGGRKLPVCLP